MSWLRDANSFFSAPSKCRWMAVPPTPRSSAWEIKTALKPGRVPEAFRHSKIGSGGGGVGWGGGRGVKKIGVGGSGTGRPEAPRMS